MRSVLIYFSLLLTVSMMAQNETLQKIKIKKETETSIKTESSVDLIQVNLYTNSAEFPGGHEALNEFMKKNAIVPKEELSLNTRVYVSFIVDADGSLNNIHIVKGSADCKPCNDEAIRLIKVMPKWIPAVAYGQALSSTIVLPIQFKLQ